ncbi:MAG: hypothetical protein JWM60_1677 [Solirubrobacterales bacterium]|nr:hypothetical protein [Solirubrobacterales bacterium]
MVVPDALAAALMPRLVQEGWKEEVPIDHFGLVAGSCGSFTRVLSSDWRMVAVFPWWPLSLGAAALGEDTSAASDRHAGWAEGIYVACRVGVVFEPAARLLGAYSDLGTMGLLMRKPTVEFLVNSRRDLLRAQDELVRFAVDDALAATRKLCVVPKMIEALQSELAVPFVRDPALVGSYGPMSAIGSSGPYARAARELVPALLGAAGEFQAAQRALDGYLASGGSEPLGEDYRRFAARLTRWLRTGGRIGLPPDDARREPVLAGVSAGAAPASFREFVRDEQRMEVVRHRAQARREAVHAVRGRGRGRSRDDLRSVLERELDARSLTLDAIDVERELDALELGRKRFGAARVVANVVNQLRNSLPLEDGVLAHAAGLIERLPATPEVPGWMRRPADASYLVTWSTRSWTRVELFSEADPLLHTVRTLDHRSIAAGLELEVWLAVAPDRNASAALLVHVGEQAVGRVLPRFRSHFADALSRAEARGERPWTQARLWSLSGSCPYLLEIATPGDGDR